MYIFDSLDIDELAKLCINIADNRLHFRIRGLDIPHLPDPEDHDKFNAFEGDLATDIIYGNMAYIYTNAPFHLDELRRQIDIHLKTTKPSYICQQNEDYTCLVRLNGFRPIWVELESEAKKEKPRGRQSKPDSKSKAKVKPPEPQAPKDAFIFQVKPLTIEMLPDWVFKMSGAVVNDDENIKQMLSIVIDDQKIFSRIPPRHIDAPLSYQLINSEYLIPPISLHYRFGIRQELANIFMAVATKNLTNPTLVAPNLSKHIMTEPKQTKHENQPQIKRKKIVKVCQY
jgi:hypothetical protein